MREVMTEAQKPGVPKRGHRAAIASDGRCVRGMAGGVNKKKRVETSIQTYEPPRFKLLAHGGDPATNAQDLPNHFCFKRSQSPISER